MAAQRYQDLAGHRYGRWIVLDFSHIDERSGGAVWLCRCDCGNGRTIRAANLRSGVSLSCGCAHKEAITIHGEAWGNRRSSEYTAWAHMKRRCIDDPNYVERGITVCEEWEDYRAFLRDMGRRPSPKHSIERIDNDKGYSKENCIWATMRTQINNRRTTIFVTISGCRLPLSEACELTGIPYDCARGRKERGWPQERWFEPVGWHWSHDHH